MNNTEIIANKRHTLAHLLAAAVLEFHPDAKNTIGPAVDNGFYYDFEFSTPLVEKDLKDIEKKMKILALIIFLAFVILVLYNIGKDRE